MATKLNLQLIQGDSKNYNLTFRDSTGAVLNISSWIIYFTVKRVVSDPNSAAILLKTVVIGPSPAGAAGTATIPLTHTDTESLPKGTYYYSIQVEPNDPTKLYTLLKGQYNIEEVADRTA